MSSQHLPSGLQKTIKYFLTGTITRNSILYLFIYRVVVLVYTLTDSLILYIKRKLVQNLVHNQLEMIFIIERTLSSILIYHK